MPKGTKRSKKAGTASPDAGGSNVGGSVRDSSDKSNEEYEDHRTALMERLVTLVNRAGRKNIADRTGIAIGTIDSWTQGRATPPALALEQIANATHCDPAWLLTGRGEPFPLPHPDSPEAHARINEAWDQLLIAATALGKAVAKIGPLVPDPKRDELRLALEHVRQALDLPPSAES